MATGESVGLIEAARLVRLWLADDDIKRNMDNNRDAARKLAVWPEWLEQIAKPAAMQERA